jgi:hypothetical protein
LTYTDQVMNFRTLSLPSVAYAAFVCAKLATIP